MGKKVCDNKCSGAIISNGEGILLINRGGYNPGYACPAGHLDGDDEETCLRKEVGEEVDLKVLGDVVLVRHETLPNSCKREGGDHHEWWVYEVPSWEGEVVTSEREVLDGDYVWADRNLLESLALKLEVFAGSLGLDPMSFIDLPVLVVATNKSEEWKANLGLEPPWYIFFKRLGMI